MDETALIAAAQGGDRRAFNELVVHYQTLIYNVAYRILGDPDRAADATQEAFISAYRGIGRFHGGSFKGWLMRIVTNACYDQLRVKKRRPTASLDAIVYSDQEESQLQGSQQERPEEYVDQQELGQLIQRGLETLPAEQRAIVVLIDIQEFQYDQVSEALGISLGTVKSRLSRGRRKLRDFLQSSAELLPSRYRLDNKTGGVAGLASLFLCWPSDRWPIDIGWLE
ncbi:MAG: sigma-70 family RNA polymerase sigma factor [Anaerolineae bacterium]|nr:sigma-70 family RNA polymerase sigma factor [Anaerolineae bacterium]